jgi:hypothetical protein
MYVLVNKLHCVLLYAHRLEEICICLHNAGDYGVDDFIAQTRSISLSAKNRLIPLVLTFGPMSGVEAFLGS